MNILVVDDSSLIRMIVSDHLRNMEIVSQIETASNGKIALEKIKLKNYDLIILDVEMPIMDGITFLKEKKNMKNDVPVLMLSSLTKSGADITFQCLELGAIDFIPKPAGGIIHINEIYDLLQQKVRDIYELKLHVNGKQRVLEKVKIEKKEIETIERKKKNYEVVFVGSSTGGPKILIEMLLEIPSDFPLPIVIVQHMPEFFTSTFAERLNQFCKLKVKEAEDGLVLQKGLIILARGNYHLKFERINDNIICKLNQEPKYNSFRPSIDVTLNNLIDLLHGKIIGIIMTGMGNDGVDSFLRLKNVGGFTIAQDEDSSVIFGMNKRAIEAGAIDIVLPNSEIVKYLLKIIEF